MSETAEEAKHVICAIIAAAGGELWKKVALYKAFYYAHLYYWQEGKGTLTDHPIVRMPRGPGIHNADQLLRELEQEGRIKVRREDFGPYQEYVYTLCGPFTINPADPRYFAVEQAVKWIEGKSAAELSHETHEYSRTWREGRDGEELDIYLDLIDDEDYAGVQRRVQEAKELIGGVFA